MQTEYLLDNLKFISQGGAVSIAVAAMLLAMSIGSWTLMVTKAIQGRRLKSSSALLAGLVSEPIINDDRHGRGFEQSGKSVCASCHTRHQRCRPL